MSDAPLKPLKVHGYTDQKQRNVDLVNENKMIEEAVLRRLDTLYNNFGIDSAMLDKSKERILEAFMWMNRAIFQPERVKLPNDTE